MARLKRAAVAPKDEAVSQTLDKVALARQGKVLDGNKQEVSVGRSGGPTLNLAIPSGAHDGLIERLTMDMVTPDPQNSRIFPVIRRAAQENYLKRCQATQTTPVYILLDKAVIENHCPQSHASFAVISKYIEDVKLLAGQIKHQGGLLQPIEVFKTGGCAATIVYGHMRYYSVAFNIGWEAAWDFKVLKEKPANLKIRQFVENHAKSGLCSVEKLLGFEQAADNLNTMFSQQNRGEPKPEDYMTSLAMTKTTFWRYNKVLSFPPLFEAMKMAIGHLELRNGLELITKAEALAKDKGHAKDDCLSYFIIKYFEQNKLVLPASIEAAKQGIIAAIERKPTEKTSAKAGRKAKSYNTPKVKSTHAIKALLTNDITKMDIDGVNWGEIDWDDKAQVNEALTATIKVLEAKLVS
ncbi:MAG: hypothetical protein ACI8WB_006031 [Phenylobacterium sp.]|jgi:hypothetical protein